MRKWIVYLKDLDSNHFHIFCNTINYSDGGKRPESVTNSQAVSDLEKHAWLANK